MESITKVKGSWRSLAYSLLSCIYKTMTFKTIIRCVTTSADPGGGGHQGHGPSKRFESVI